MNKLLPPRIAISLIAAVALILLLSQCSNDYTPKPRGFLRIDLPDKEYTLFDSVFPYTFEYPVYAKVVKDPVVEDRLMARRFNVEFSPVNGTLHLTYEPLRNNLDTLIGDAVEFVYKHVPKATTISKSVISRPEDQVFGTLFHIKGKSAASTYQFYVTDSTENFMRGALYLNTYTDNDSLKPVLDFLKIDVDHFINTLKWK
jgi:gliding motility-associated lipoprotein GldD